jgi:hypothetical protein
MVSLRCESLFTWFGSWGAGVVCDGRAEQLPRPLGVSRYIETAIGHVPEDSGRHDDSKEHQGDGLHVEVLADSPLRLSESDDLADRVKIATQDLHDALAVLGVSGVNVVGKDDARDGSALANEADVPH